MTTYDTLSLTSVLNEWPTSKDFPVTNWMMFTRKIACDVSFCVGVQREIIPAHKFILVSRSSVFLTMFYGPLAEKSKVEIPDSDKDTFLAFMEYMYTNNVDVTVNNVVGLLYLGKKYAVPTLNKKCLDFLTSALRVENACDILDQAHLYSEVELEKKALTLISLNALDVFMSPAFKDICRSCLIKILKSDDLRAEEMDVFTSVLWWSEAECERREMDPTPDNKCEVLGDVVNYIRFPLIGWKVFDSHVGILDKQWMSLLRPFFETTSDYSVKPRKPVPTRLYRFPRSENSVSWIFNNRTDAISFVCDKPIKLLGVILYGTFPNQEADDTTSYSVVCSVEEDLRQDYQSHTFFKGGNVMEGSNINRTVIVNTKDEFVEIYFEKPVHLEEDLKYTVLLNMSGLDSRRGCKGYGYVNMDGVSWTFFTSTKSKNSTDVEHGQIPGVIFSV